MLIHSVCDFNLRSSEKEIEKEGLRTCKVVQEKHHDNHENSQHLPTRIFDIQQRKEKRERM